MMTPKDADIREALKRKYAGTPTPDAALISRLMRNTTHRTKKRTYSLAGLYIFLGTAAACAALLLAFHLIHRPDAKPIAQPVEATNTIKKNVDAPTTAIESTENLTPVTQSANKADTAQTAVTKQTVRPEKTQTREKGKTDQKLLARATHNPETADPKRKKTERQTKRENDEPGNQPTQGEPHESATAKPPAVVAANHHQTSSGDIHYASYEMDASAEYQAPGLIDDYIAKLAEYNGIKPIVPNCGTDTLNPTKSDMAYDFPEKKEIDVIGRMIMLAATFDYATPGYQLNLSDNQLVFQLHDTQQNLKYIWIAERISDKHTLLYATHLPIDTHFSTECYLRLREEITHRNTYHQL